MAQHKTLIYDMGGDACDASLLAIEDCIFEVTATAGDAHLGTPRTSTTRSWMSACRIPRKKNRGKDLGGNDPAVRHVRTQCERAKRTLSFSTQVTIEIDALLDCTAFPVAFSKAWFKELNMDYLRTSKEPVERCLGDGGIDKRSVHDVVHVRGFPRSPVAENVIQEFFSQWEQIHQSRRSAPFFVAGRYFAVHGGEDSWWCDYEADRA